MCVCSCVSVCVCVLWMRWLGSGHLTCFAIYKWCQTDHDQLWVVHCAKSYLYLCMCTCLCVYVCLGVSLCLGKGKGSFHLILIEHWNAAGALYCNWRKHREKFRRKCIKHLHWFDPSSKENTVKYRNTTKYRKHNWIQINNMIYSSYVVCISLLLFPSLSELGCVFCVSQFANVSR